MARAFNGALSKWHRLGIKVVKPLPDLSGISALLKNALDLALRPIR